MNIPHQCWMRAAVATVAMVAMTSEIAVAQMPWRWKLSVGDVLHYDMDQQSQTETKVGGKPTTATVKMAMRLTWRVEKIDDQAGAAITQTIDRLSTTMQVDTLEPVMYDSAAQSATSTVGKDIAESVKPILGAPFTIQLSGRGEVVSVQPSKEIQDALEKLKARSGFSPEALLRVVQQASLVLPEQPVTPGASWESTNETASPLGNLQQTTRYTYVGPAELKGQAYEKIDTDTDLKLQKSKDSTANTVIQESEQRGTLWFDAMRGRLVASETKQRLVTQRPYRDVLIRVQSITTATATLVE